MKFLYTLIFVGSIILPLSPMGEEFTSSMREDFKFSNLTLMFAIYRDNDHLDQFSRSLLVVSKTKLGLFIADQLSSVKRVYDLSSSEDTRIYYHLSKAPENYRTLFFTAETNAGEVVPDIQCTVNYSIKSRIIPLAATFPLPLKVKERVMLLLQNCENNAFVFHKKEIQIPLSEIEPSDSPELRTVME